MRAFNTLFKTELKLSLRGLDMFIFAICMPLVALVIIGLIYDTFPQQSFGAISTISICAGGVMGLPLVVSDYRQKHILKRLQVTPVRPGIILLVQVTIYALYAFVSLVTLFAVASLFFGFKLQGRLLHFLLGWLFVMASMFSIGMMVGGIAKNSKMAGIIASLLYFPMLIFSGATLPYEVMPPAMQQIVNFMPLTQGIKLLKSTIVGTTLSHAMLPVVILMIMTLLCASIAIKYFRWD